MEALQKLRADLEAWSSRLAPRERVMVAAAGFAVIAFILVMGFTAGQKAIARREASIDRKTEVLARIDKLAASYRKSQSERMAMEARLKAPPLQLMSHVSQTGQRLGIEVTDLRPGVSVPATAGSQVLEDTVEINLPKLELSRLANLLTELEKGPSVVKIRRLAVRTRNDDPTAVDATIVVATYKLKG